VPASKLSKKPPPKSTIANTLSKLPIPLDPKQLQQLAKSLALVQKQIDLYQRSISKSIRDFTKTDYGEPSMLILYQNQVPPLLRPFFLGYSYVLGYIFYLYFLLVYKTSVVEFEEEKDKNGKVRNYLKERDNYIFCSWHESSFAMFVIAQYLRDHPEIMKFKQFFLTHPRWSLGPLYLLCEKTGCKIVMGSSLYEGKKGADEVVEALKSGYSTVVFPDGPYGPLHEIKKGNSSYGFAIQSSHHARTC